MIPASRRLSLPIAVAVLAVALLVVVGVLGGGGQVDQGDPSSRSAGRAGTLAMYEWMRDGLGLGDQVSRVSGDYRLDGLDLLVVEQPTTPFTDADTAAVEDFARGGGEVLVAVDQSTLGAVAGLLDDVHAEPRSATGLAATATPDQPLSTAGDVGRVPVDAGGVVFADRAEVTPMLSTPEGPVMVGAPFGSGRVYVLGSPYPLSNVGLRPDGGTPSDAGALVLAVLERARGGHVGFDEVHHGEGAGAVGAAAVFDGPIGIAAGLTAAVLLVFLLLSGRRLGRPLPAGDASRVPSAGEFVTALAQLYERSRLRGPVAERYGDELKARISTVTGVDRHLDDRAFTEALRGHGEDRAVEVGETLHQARALARGRPDDASLLRLARRVDEVERAWTAGAPG